MLAVVPMFALPGTEQVAAFGIKCLAVVGGYGAGYLLGGVAAWALDRWVFARKAPDFVKQTIKILSGVALAILVALLVFGSGSGGGLFGGGGGPDGTGTGTPNPDDTGKKHEQPTPPPDPKVPKVDAPPTPAISPEDPKVRVTFLGGDAVKENRFYLVDDDPHPRTFDELKAEITKRKEGTARPMFLLVQFPTDPRHRIDENSINVTQVTSWARNVAGIEVVWPGKK